MGPFIQPLMTRLVPVLLNKNISRALPENAAITIGRLCLIYAEAVAPTIDTFIQPWYILFNHTLGVNIYVVSVTIWKKRARFMDSVEWP